MPPSSIGKLCPGVELQIRDPENGKVCGAGQLGEICVKSECVFASYYKNPEASFDCDSDRKMVDYVNILLIEQATARAFTNGWFMTGDIGYYDENHFLFLVDRIKDIFKYFNNHVSYYRSCTLTELLKYLSE